MQKYYLIRAINELTVFEFDSLDELMENYRDGDIVTKKIPVVSIPE